jgi:hypothetical protein
MNTAQDRHRIPQLKASDADRDAVVAALSEHFQAGRLTTDELEDRTGQALTARTVDELDALTADLPGLMHPGPTPAAPPRRLRYPVLVAAAVVLAVLAVVSLVLGSGHGHHGWDVWWVIPVGLLIARRLAGGPGGRRSRRAPW